MLFDAYEDTRTPFYNTVIVAAVNAAPPPRATSCFRPAGPWSVWPPPTVSPTRSALASPWNRLRKRLGGDLDGTRVLQTYARLGIASVPAALLSGAACYGIGHTLGQGVGGSLAALLAGGIALLGVFYVAARENADRRTGTQWSEWSAGAWGAEAGVRAQPSSVAVCRA